MLRTVIAMHNESLSNTICDALEKNGISVRFRCRTGAESIRAVKKMGGGVIICDYKLPDMTADQLAGDVQETATLLVVAKPNLLAMCECEDAFKIPVPVRLGELIGAVNMLLQMDSMRAAKSVPKRSTEDQALVSQAKALLMDKSGMSEDAAYRYLQRKSMETCAKLAETAKLVLESLR